MTSFQSRAFLANLVSVSSSSLEQISRRTSEFMALGVEHSSDVVVSMRYVDRHIM